MIENYSGITCVVKKKSYVDSIKQKQQTDSNVWLPITKNNYRKKNHRPQNLKKIVEILNHCYLYITYCMAKKANLLCTP